MSIIDFRETLSVEVRVMAFVKYFMRGSLKGEVSRPHMGNLVLIADI